MVMVVVVMVMMHLMKVRMVRMVRMRAGGVVVKVVPGLVGLRWTLQKCSSSSSCGYNACCSGKVVQS